MQADTPGALKTHIPAACRTTWRWVLPCLAAAWAGCIFFISSRPGAVSGAASEQITRWITSDATVNTDSFFFLETLLRKCGHVAEYAVLGALLAISARLWARRTRFRVFAPLFTGCVVAVADEFFQAYIPGRSGQATDVLIDLAGICTGLALVLAAAAARRRYCKPRAIRQNASGPP